MRNDRVLCCVPMLVLLAFGAPVRAAEQRCGWLDNPTPGNFSLIDRDGEWVLAEQGNYEAPGFDRLGDLTTRGWVRSGNGSYGHGCACLQVTVNRQSHRIARIVSGRAVPLRQCRADPGVREPR